MRTVLSEKKRGDILYRVFRRRQTEDKPHDRPKTILDIYGCLTYKQVSDGRLIETP